MKFESNRGELSAAGFRFAIVASRWNASITTKLTEGAVEALASVGASDDAIEIFRVPGAFELPLACQEAADTGEFDAVIALGVVIRGDTPHFDYVAGQAASGITQASLTTGIPILFGVITADTLEQALARSGEKEDNKGYEAALSAIEMAMLLRRMNERGLQGKGEDKVFPHVA